MGETELKSCRECRAPQRGDQRYCLACGARAGARNPLLEPILRRARGPQPARPAPADADDAPAGLEPSPGWGAGLALPSRKVCAALVLAFLGFGVIIGGAASPRVPTLNASARRQLKLVIPSRPPAASTASSGAASSSGEAPAADSESQAGAEAEPAPSSSSSSSSSARASASAPSTSVASSPAPSSAEGGSPPSQSRVQASTLPPIKHVFVIVLSDQPYAAVFGPASGAPYLAHTLEARGALLSQYYAVAHQELADEIALISGQGPTAQTASDCPTFSAIAPASLAADGQVVGSGCIYPASTQTLGGQLSAKHLTWRAYVEGIGEGAGPGACAHPLPGEADPTAAAPPGGESYATFSDPFVYFESVIGSPACAKDDVGLKQLSADLAAPARTPSFSYIVPDRCHDGAPSACAPGAPAGLQAADGFLQHLVGQILASKAYRQNGLIVITVDQAPSSGEFADSSSCCGQPQYPNAIPAPPGATATRKAGGGQVGALLLSPFIKPGTSSQEPYNHFSLLRTVEDLFGLKHLGYAGLPRVSSFEPSLFSVRKAG